MDATTVERGLEGLTMTPEEALAALADGVRDAPTSARRLEACVVLGSLAGRAYGASWEVAERAAFVLLEVARETDAAPERARLLGAMGRGLRNAWLVPYVHARLDDDAPEVAAAAIAAAGGLAFRRSRRRSARFPPRRRSPRRFGSGAHRARPDGRAERRGRVAAHVPSGGREGAAALTALTGSDPVRPRRRARPPRGDARARGSAGGGALPRRDPGAPRCSPPATPRARGGRGSPSRRELRLARLSRRDAHGGRRAHARGAHQTDRAVQASLARRLRTLP
ncbi:MAG: hypothetical protein R3B82_24515 [Sandaracinaceae bacterium]